MSFDAVLFDLGGVMFEGPMCRFAAYEKSAGLPSGFIRRVNSTNPDGNAWARAERGEISPTDFLTAFADDVRGLGYEVDAQQVVNALSGRIYPEMTAALDPLRQAGLRVAAVTNNMTPIATSSPQLRQLAQRFDVVVESSVEGVRKPELAFFRIALDRLRVPAERCVYLDDLGINLKPARALGMTTIKVVEIDAALAELERCVGFRVT